MILYISGPITDRPNHQEEFEGADEWLQHSGYSTINPLQVAPIVAGHLTKTMHKEDYTWEHYMRGDIAAMMGAEGVALLDGHEKSRGSHLEKRIAFELGIPIMTVRQWIDLV